MTQEITNAQQFPVAPETYWRELCLNLDYQARLFNEALHCQSMQVLELEGDYEHGMKRRLRFTQTIDAPAAITKMFGSLVTLEEQSEFDPREQCWSYRMVPSLLGDRIDIRGRVRLVEKDGGVEQHSVNTVSCKMFGLGSLIEHFVARSTVQGNADKAAFTRRYIEEKKLR